MNENNTNAPGRQDVGGVNGKVGSAVKIRVQMVSDGIPAYQNDFYDMATAEKAIRSLAGGAKVHEGEPLKGELFRFEGGRTTITAFVLPSPKLAVEDRKLVEWPSVHSDKAVREGWDIWDSEGSDNGHWQVQRIDDPSAFVEATGFAPPKLVSDDDAFRIVANSNQPHHIAAREFLKTHNPKEYHSVMGFAERKLADLYTVDGQIITTGKFSGFKLVAQSAFGVKTDIVNVYSRNGRCIGYVTEGDIDGFIAGNGKVMTPEGGWPVKWSPELIDLFDLRKSAAYQTALAALGSSNRNLASIDDVSPRKLPKPSLMDDAQWIMNFLKSIEENGNHAPTETMQRLIDAIGELQVTPRIVIGLEGGIIQGATSNVPIEYLVYDYDIEGADGDDIAVRPALDGGEVEVFDSGVRIPEIDAVIVDTVFAAAEVSESLGKDTPSPGM
jgi:hypothetical protein